MQVEVLFVRDKRTWPWMLGILASRGSDITMRGCGALGLRILGRI